MKQLGLAAAVVAGLMIAWWLRHTDKPAAAPTAARVTSAAPVSPSAAPAPVARELAKPVVQPSQRPLVRDATQPGYDAARLFALRQRDAAALFTAEPRDDAWAQPREAELERFAAPAFQHVDPSARLETECHTGICRVRIHSKNAYLNNQMAPYPLSCLAAFAEPDWADPASDDPTAEIYLIFDDDTRGTGFQTRQGTTCEKFRPDWETQAPHA